MKRKRSETAVIFASERNEAKPKRNYFRFDAKKLYENEMKRKNEKEAKTSKQKRKKLNSGTICKETKKNIKVCPSFCQVYT
jgi:hypothetical protein